MGVAIDAALLASVPNSHERGWDHLGGSVRDSVPFAAYLSYKWAGHPPSTRPASSSRTAPLVTPAGPGCAVPATRRIGVPGRRC
ncbi:hypothetical protein [Streptomyces sp. GESEQ-35]|uniref:hypothetical protein n=1 Tax=Streptomyces sp. GESEQ-35 TaxID=2812657 RepID=UPI0035ABCE39